MFPAQFSSAFFLAASILPTLTFRAMATKTVVAASETNLCDFDSEKARNTCEEANTATKMQSVENWNDDIYPGTAVKRMLSIRERVKTLSSEQLSGDWSQDVRPLLLWAGGLKDDRRLTGHAFNDWNHCDLTAMQMIEAHNENEGRVAGMHQKNRLGSHIVRGSVGMDELGPGGSWSTCMMGCNQVDPATGEGGRDVAHIQFRARIAFKLVWVPPEFTSFVLVDDSGELLAGPAVPGGRLPHPSQRRKNYAAVRGSQYAVAADEISKRDA